MTVAEYLARVSSAEISELQALASIEAEERGKVELDRSAQAGLNRRKTRMKRR